jgi:hypothetical protein
MATEEGRPDLACTKVIVWQDDSGQDRTRRCECVNWWRLYERIEGNLARKIPTSFLGPEEWSCEDGAHIVPRPSKKASDLDALPRTDPYGDRLRGWLRDTVGGGGRPDDPPGI